MNADAQAAHVSLSLQAGVVAAQAQKLQKRELNQQRNGVDGEDIHMGSAKAAKRQRRKRAHGDVEMADAEVPQLSPC